MKKNTLLFAGLLSIGTAFCQDKKVIDKIVLFYTQKKIEAAKTEIDKLAADPTNASNAEIWAWKSTIDAEMIASDELKSKCADCLNSGFEAFKKYEALDNSYKVIAETPFNWRPLSIFYDKFYAIGSVEFKEKNYIAALENFEKSAIFSKIIMKKDLRKNNGALDTLPILMAGYAAQNAQKMKEALAYYSIAADFKYGGKDDIDMYKYLLIGYSDLKDKASFEKYYAITQTIYPQTNFEDYKLDFINKNLSLDEKLQTYKTEDAKGGLSGAGYLEFGVMFSNLKKEDKIALEKDEEKKNLLHTTAIDALKKSYAKSNDTLAAFNIGILYYNGQNELDEKRAANVRAMQDINTNKVVEKDPKKKAAADAKIKEQLEPLKKANAMLETKIQADSDNAIEWLEKAYTGWKDKVEKNKIEKQSFKNAVKYLGILFESKREKVKGKDPKAYDAFDAKSKMYFALFETK
jgi:hypothetical protein